MSYGHEQYAVFFIILYFTNIQTAHYITYANLNKLDILTLISY
jgi:hypothetical protein